MAPIPASSLPHFESAAPYSIHSILPEENREVKKKIKENKIQECSLFGIHRYYPLILISDIIVKDLYSC